MRDYIFRLQLDISRLCVWSFFVIAFLLLWRLSIGNIMSDMVIYIFGITLWVGVLIETINLMLPESDEPHDWQ